MSDVSNLMRVRKAHESSKVTFIELFFDLVFVFAITQLSPTLMQHFTVSGAAQVLLLTVAVWWVWVFTSWVTNWLEPEQLPVRCALLTLMLLELILSASLPQAFGARGLIFAIAYVAMQVGRSLFFCGRCGATRSWCAISSGSSPGWRCRAFSGSSVPWPWKVSASRGG